MRDTRPGHSQVTADQDAGPAVHQHVSWSVAVAATLHCLTGCAIGEVLGMVAGTALGLNNASTVVLSVGLAFVFGYGLTMRGVARAGVPFGSAFKIALPPIPPPSR